MNDFIQTIHLAKMRTLDECYAEIKELDPNTSISKHYIRQLALSGKIPVVMAGRKRLINLDKLIEYLDNPTSEQVKGNIAAAQGGIRPIY
jgi:excisionase family DNA binding protein